MAALSRAAERNHAYIQQFLTRGVPAELPEHVRDRLAPVLGVSPDALRERPKAGASVSAPAVMPPPSPRNLPRDVPVMGTAMGGDGSFLLNQGDPIDMVRRGPGIAQSRTVFAIYVEGESMSPRFDPGDLIYLDPARPVRIGDDVVLVMASENAADPPLSYLKRLVRRTADRVIAEQFNPAQRIEYPTRNLKQMVRVLKLAEVMGL